MRKENEIIFGVIIDREIKEKFIKKARENEATASQLIRKFIKDYLRGN